MTKEEFYKLIKQVNKDAEVYVTWSLKDKDCLNVWRVKQVKINLTYNRLELSIDDC